MGEYDEYRCSACKKAIKSLVIKCKTCPKLFYHPGCVNKHKTYDKNRELVQCNGPFEQFNAEENTTTKSTTPADTRERRGSNSSSGHSRDRLGSNASSSGSKGTSLSGGADVKIDWLIKTVREMKNDIACKNEVKSIVKEIVKEEMESVKHEIEIIKKMLQGGSSIPINEGIRTYSQAAKEKKKEKVIIVKPKVQQESEATKKAIKEMVDIKSMDVGISRLKKCSNGTVIMGCETGREMETLKAVVQEKMGENFNVTESSQIKPKLKIVNVEEDELQLEDEELVSVIKRQNGMEEIEGREMRIVKKIIKEVDQERIRRGWEEGFVIIEVDEETHQELLNKGKLNVGWRRCPVYNHINVRRCFKCWGYYHIAKNCIRNETCHKCSGAHKASDCTVNEVKCVNCKFKNDTYNLRIDTEHDALDRDCPTYKRAVQEEKRRAGWED